MLVDSMTFDEVRKEVMSEYDTMLRIAYYRKKSAEHFAKRQTKFPCVYLTEWMSPKKNRWLIMYILFKRNTHKGKAGIMGCCFQKYPKGFALHQTALNYNKDVYITTYLPHFFERYAERMHVDKTGVDLIKHFYRHNHAADNDTTQELSGKGSRTDNSIHMCFDEGIGMGEYLNFEHVVLKTFVTYDMTSGEQKEVFSEMRIPNEDSEKRHKEMWYKHDPNYRV